MRGRPDSDVPQVGSARACVPERIELGGQGRRLRIRWPDGLEAVVGAAALRVACRCGGCTQGRRDGVRPQIAPEIRLDEVLELGIAGLQLVFSDGHRRGIFPWDYLRELAMSAA